MINTNKTFQQISPNMLKTFEQCPRKFYLKYVKSISMPVNDDVFVFGKNIHALASYYLRKENIDKMESVLKQEEKEIWNYLKSSVYFSYDVVNTEYSLSVKLGSVFFSGRLDALVHKDERYFILDYKTGSAPKNAKMDYQTIIYTLAVREMFKTDKISFVYLDLRNRAEVKIDFSSDLLEVYTKKLVEQSEKINNVEFFNKKRENCNCEYSIICF